MVIDHGSLVYDGTLRRPARPAARPTRTLVVDLVDEPPPIDVPGATVTRVEGPRQWLSFPADASAAPAGGRGGRVLRRGRPVDPGAGHRGRDPADLLPHHRLTRRPDAVRQDGRMTSSTPTRTVDVLGKPYRAETIELAADDEGEVVATLVHRPSRGTARPGGAARARLRRLLLPDRRSRLLGRARLRLLRARPAQVRPLPARAPDPQLRHRPHASTTRRSTRPTAGSPSATATTTSSSPRTRPAG